MKHLYKATFCIFFLPLISIAQSSFKPGYIVTSKGDTVKGYIDYKGWGVIPAKIYFKKMADNSNKKSYAVSDINAISITGITEYKKMRCSISLDETNLAHIDVKDTSKKVDTVLLQVLQRGKNLAFYSYTDAKKTRYYTGEAPFYTPIELVYRIYNVFDVANGATRVTDEDTYMKQLFTLANKYKAKDELSVQIQKAHYNRDDLLKIVSFINGISKEEYNKKYNERTRIKLYVNAGLNIAGISSNSNSGYAQGGGISHTSFSPAGAIGINIDPNPNGETIEF